MSRESTRTSLTHAILNDLPVCASDIQNAYLQYRSSEKHYVVCGVDFELENAGIMQQLLVLSIMGNLLEPIVGGMVDVIWNTYASQRANSTLMSNFDLP